MQDMASGDLELKLEGMMMIVYTIIPPDFFVKSEPRTRPDIMTSLFSVYI